MNNAEIRELTEQLRRLNDTLELLRMQPSWPPQPIYYTPAYAVPSSPTAPLPIWPGIPTVW